MAEILDIVDRDGNPTGETVSRTIAHRDGIRHRTAHVWLLRHGLSGETEILLQKRCADKDSFPGCYDISSAGHIPAGQSFGFSAVRELREELGLTVTEDALCPCGIRRVYRKLPRQRVSGRSGFDDLRSLVHAGDGRAPCAAGGNRIRAVAAHRHVSPGCRGKPDPALYLHGRTRNPTPRHGNLTGTKSHTKSGSSHSP